MPSKLKPPKILKNAIRKRLMIFYFILVGQTGFSQLDSLILYADTIKPGMSTALVDSLLPFQLKKMHNAAGGTWRYIYDSTYQSSKEYQDKDWNSFTFRMLFRADKLIFIDLYSFKLQKVLFEKSDRLEVVGLVNRFNTQYAAKDTLGSILQSYFTTTYGLDNALENFFASATTKQKVKLFSYAKSLCPEYSASALLKLLELEKTKPFLTKSEKVLLKSLMDSDIEIKFAIGCLFKQQKFNDFIEEYKPDLKDVLR